MKENLSTSGFNIIKYDTTISELLHFVALAPSLTNLNARQIIFKLLGFFPTLIS